MKSRLLARLRSARFIAQLVARDDPSWQMRSALHVDGVRITPDMQAEAHALVVAMNRLADTEPELHEVIKLATLTEDGEPLPRPVMANLLGCSARTIQRKLNRALEVIEGHIAFGQMEGIEIF